MRRHAPAHDSVQEGLALSGVEAQDLGIEEALPLAAATRGPWRSSAGRSRGEQPSRQAARSLPEYAHNSEPFGNILWHHCAYSFPKSSSLFQSSHPQHRSLPHPLMLSASMGPSSNLVFCIPQKPGLIGKGPQTIPPPCKLSCGAALSPQCSRQPGPGAEGEACPFRSGAAVWTAGDLGDQSERWGGA